MVEYSGKRHPEGSWVLHWIVEFITFIPFYHGYETPGQALNPYSAAEHWGTWPAGRLYPPPSAGLFDYTFCFALLAKSKSH